MRFALGILIGLAACSPASPGAPAAAPCSEAPPSMAGLCPRTPGPLARTGNRWSDCYRSFQPSDDPVADLAALGEACAAEAGLRPIGDPHEGADQGAGDPPERLAFRARRGCYRAFAVGGSGVSDLDVAFYDPQGRIAAGDVSRDRWPVVPPRGPLCVQQDGLYTVAVSVARGRGSYLLQLWGSRSPVTMRPRLPIRAPNPGLVRGPSSIELE